MQAYRFYFLGSDDHIRAVEVIDCADDAAAKQKAEALLHERNGFAAIEVWREKDMVHQVRRA
jgi:predicted dinucleotide-binding enzyme